MNHSQPSSEITAIWEWQSNAYAWCSEPEEWTCYLTPENQKLEAAYKNNQEVVDLGHHFVFIADMLQVRKDDGFIQRKVRRTGIDEDHKPNKETNARAQRFYGPGPKTYNNAFGSVSDFLAFFEKRDPGINKFAKLFKEVEAAENFDRFNSEILPLLIDSFDKEATRINKKKQVKELIELFQIKFTNYQQFYAEILRAYSKDTFLYKNLNLYLRNEDWDRLKCLFPYVFCIFKAFLCPDLGFVHYKDQGQQRQSSNKMMLYRGSQLDKKSLSLYNSKQGSHFSWNALTSTSKDRDAAECFMGMEEDQNKTCVIFNIEIPLNSDSLLDQLLIDLHPFSDYKAENEVLIAPGSAFEVTSIIQDNEKVEIGLRLVTDIDLLKIQGQIMYGAMQAEIKEEGLGKIYCLQGPSLEEAIWHLKNNSFIQELEFTLCSFDKKAFEVLKQVLPTVSNVTSLAFDSGPDAEDIHLNVILEALKKLDIKTLQIRDPFLEKKEHLTAFSRQLKQSTSLTKLSLNFERCENISNLRVLDLCREGISHLSSLRTLDLNFAFCNQILDSGLSVLCSQGIGKLTSLKALSLNFYCCWRITDIGLKHISSEGLKHLKDLTTLTLNFGQCVKITDPGFTELCSEGIRYLESLTALAIIFERCDGVTDVELSNFGSKGVSYLNLLRTLDLNFAFCKITDSGLKNFCSQGLRNLNALTTLNLNFDSCWKITDKGFKSLFSDVLEILTSLTSMSLSFHAGQITDLGLRDLSKGLRNLSLLKILKLNFADCLEISDSGLGYLCSQGIQHLTLLKILSLNFGYCQKITDIGLASISTQALKHSTRIEILDLEFEGSKQISDTGLKNLYQGIKCLILLRELYLNFKESIKITNLALENFCSEEIVKLPSLKSLDLDFSYCSNVTDGGLNRVSTQVNTSKIILTLNKRAKKKARADKKADKQRIYKRKFKNLSIIKTEDTFVEINSDNKISGNVIPCQEKFLLKLAEDNLYLLRSLEIGYNMNDADHPKLITFWCEWASHLISLTKLRLYFSICGALTDSDLFALTKGIKTLTSLTSLELCFGTCIKFTDSGFNNLCSQGIQNLTSLKTLSLTFTGCGGITDEGLNTLGQKGLKSLISLTDLTLCFVGCIFITDSGLKKLCYERIREMSSLTTLYLDFERCKSISDAGFTEIEIFLKQFGFN